MAKKTSDKLELEFEDAPSGYVTMYHYKLPMMRFNAGYGYVGALLFDGTTDKIQCHFCGEWFDYLANHIRKEHSMSAADYKRTVGLNNTTALINETVRAKLIANGIRARKQNLRSRKGIKMSAETKAKISATLKENRDENKNLNGTCPEQLISRLVALHRQKGRTPLRKEIGFINALEKTYGTVKEAMRVAGLEYRPPGPNLKGTKYTEEYVTHFIRDFFDANGRLPKKIEMKRLYEVARTRKYNWKELERKALAMDGRYRQSAKRVYYTKEDLLNFLRMFKEINGRYPSTSDCKRGLLPTASKYIYHWGSWQKALAAAYGTQKS